MTYCVALNLKEGMMFAADTRTNAGIDQVACFRKLRTFSKAGERVIVIMSAGNLATTQSVISILERRAALDDTQLNILNAPSLYDIAILIGATLREVQNRDTGSGATLGQSTSVDLAASFLIGGQIKGERQRLFHIYPQGNFIESSEDTPFLQIGESKYGKPILDRVVKHDCDLHQAEKCVLISFDSTIRSNLSVGLPLDFVVYLNDSFTIHEERRIHKDDLYFSQLSRQWSEGLQAVFKTLPMPPL